MVSREEFIETELIPVWCLSMTGRTNCPICTEPFTDPVKLPCAPNHHIYCRQCITEWLEQRSTCPECRHPLFEVQAAEAEEPWIPDDEVENDDDDDDEDDDEEPLSFDFDFGVSANAIRTYQDESYDHEPMYYWYDVRGHAENGEQTTWVWDQNQIDYVQHNVSGQVNVDKETLSLALVTMGNYILEMAARRHHRPYSVLQQGQWAAMLDQVRQQFIDRFDWQHFDVATMPTQWRDELRDSSQDMFIPFLGLHRDNVTVNLADWVPYQQDLMILLEYLAYAAWAEERRRSEERDSHMVDNDE